jgi:hypothetical protein
MKEATGELNMTVITLVAISAIAAVFYFVVWPMIQQALVTQTCKTSYGSEYTAVKVDSGSSQQNAGTSQAKVNKWQCCPKGTTSGDSCVAIQD